MADDGGFESTIEDEIEQASQNGSIQVPGLSNISGVNAEVNDIEPDNSSDNSSGIGAGGIVGVAFASLTVLLLAVFWITRRRTKLFFQEVGDGDIIVKDSDDETTPKRRVHIFGEKGSVATKWTSQKKDGDVSESGVISLKSPPSSGQEAANPESIQKAYDFQEYSPSLFENSEEKVGRIPPSPPQLPSNNERGYLVEDSVYL